MSEEAANRLVMRGALATGVGFALRLGARLGFLFLAGRLFGAAAFGAYALGVAAVESGVGLAGLSLKKVLFQLLEDNHDRRTAGRPDAHVLLDACAMVLLASAGVAAFIMAGACIAAGGLPTHGPYLALFCLAPMVAGQTLADVLLAASRWKHLIRYEVVGRSLVEPYTQVIVALAAWAAGWSPPGSLGALIAAYWAGNLTLNLYALAGVRRGFGALGLARYRPAPRRLAGMLRGLAPNTATDLLGGLYTRLDLYLVGALMGAHAAGVYAMAQQVRTPIKQVRQSFDGLLIPLVARTIGVKGAAAAGRSLASAARLLLAIQAPVLAALIAFGEPLLHLFGPGFGEGYVALALLAGAETMQASLGLGDLLLVYLAPQAGLAMAGIAFVTGLVAVGVLTPLYGLAGAAGAMLAAMSLQALIRRWFLHARFRHSAPLTFAAAPLVAGAAGLAAMILVRGPAHAAFVPRDAAALAAGLALYAALLAAWLKARGERLRITGLTAS